MFQLQNLSLALEHDIDSDLCLLSVDLVVGQVCVHVLENWVTFSCMLSHQDFAFSENLQVFLFCGLRNVGRGSRVQNDGWDQICPVTLQNQTLPWNGVLVCVVAEQE